jgi:DNA repair protein RecO (recombination protein O)
MVKRESSEAIVLHTYQVRERDKLAVFLTPEHGKKRGWAYGARSLKSRFGSSLEPLSKVRVRWLEREGEEVVRIESIELLRSLFDAHTTLARSVAASYLAETADTFAQADEPSELVYRLLDRTSGALLATGRPLAVVAYAEVWTLKLAGILHSPRECIDCREPIDLPLSYDPDSSGFACDGCRGRNAWLVPNDVTRAVEDLLRLPVEQFAAALLTDATLWEIRSLARSIRRSFLGHELKSHDILTTALAGG